MPSGEIFPEEILLDARNLPSFNTAQFEGRIETAISKGALLWLAAIFASALMVLISRAGWLELVNGQTMYARSRANSLREEPEYAPRGEIVDRRGVKLAWNDTVRTYTKDGGFGHLLGYISYSQATSSNGSAFSKKLVGVEGVEQAYNQTLEGAAGVQLNEVDALGRVQSAGVRQLPTPGATLDLTVDARLEHALYESIKAVADERDFTGGTGIIMNVKTGEILALTNYPEYDPNALVPGYVNATALGRYLNDKRKPFLNRAVSGLYTPGSVVKPIIALGALNEGVITAQKQILSTGQIQIANPYRPGVVSVFKDWRAQGWVDMRHALAVSSDVYFYEVGGGFGDQPGLGIANIEKYARMFGLAQATGVDLTGEPTGTIPSPAWKAAHFKGEPWRIGDTYHTAIGQYGFQITPLQLLRAVAAIANYGAFVVPHVAESYPTSTPTSSVSIGRDKFEVVHEGMRMSAQFGTAAGINVPYVTMAGKTGTAELGVSKAYVNSWVTGFFPYQNPTYAFVVVMEHGKRTNTIGAVAVMRNFLDWMHLNTPDYFR